MVLPIFQHEMNNALTSLKMKQAPGPDDVTDDMLVHWAKEHAKNSSRFSTLAGNMGMCHKYGEEPFLYQFTR